MKKRIYLLTLSCFLLFSCGNKSKRSESSESVEILTDITEAVREISIDAANARPLNLSEIAENVTPIVLERSPGGTKDFLLTKDYLFGISMSSIAQYDLSGKFIREIRCGGIISFNATTDTVKKELYVPVGNKIKCYDYAGNFLREYSLTTESSYCLYHKGCLLVQSFEFKPDNTTDYFINRINLSTGEVMTLSFEKKDQPFQVEDGIFVQMTALCLLTIHNDNVFSSFEFDDALYRIQRDSVIDFAKWTISPAANTNDKKMVGANGLIGDYIFVNYRRNNQSSIYFENMKTGKQYNVSNVVDDVFYTDGNCNILPLNQTGFFYFTKDRGNIEGSSIGGIPLKNGSVVFIGKMK